MSVSTCQSKHVEGEKAQVISELERRYIVLTQNGLPLVESPYQVISEQLGISEAQTIEMTKSLLERGIIRRVAAVPQHYKLGYTFNGMTVWDVSDEHASEMGRKIGALPFVSHCYLRPRHLPDWNYNLFAMVHGKNADEIEQFRSQIKQILQPVLQTHNMQSNDMLTSSKILKKTGLRIGKARQKSE